MLCVEGSFRSVLTDLLCVPAHVYMLSNCCLLLQVKMLRSLALALVAAASTEAFMAPAAWTSAPASNRAVAKSGLSSLSMKVCQSDRSCVCWPVIQRAFFLQSTLAALLYAIYLRLLLTSNVILQVFDWKRRAALAADPTLGNLAEGKVTTLSMRCAPRYIRYHHTHVPPLPLILSLPRPLPPATMVNT